MLYLPNTVCELVLPKAEQLVAKNWPFVFARYKLSLIATPGLLLINVLIVSRPPMQGVENSAFFPLYVFAPEVPASTQSDINPIKQDVI